MRWPLIITVLLLLQSPAAPTADVVFETELGNITVRVDVARAPGTAANFLKYVDGGFYDGGRFHRAVRPGTESRTDISIQVIQGGINPDRRAEGFPAIPLERTSVTGLKHVDGAISMARGAPADSARSDVFLCIGDQPSLDFGGARNPDGQGFAAFGRVVSGMEIVRKIQAAPVRQGTESLDPPIRIVRARRAGPRGPA